MSSNASWLSLAALVIAFAGSTAARAALETRPVHPVYTNARFQIGDGLPIPITDTPPPRGRINVAAAIATPTVMQATTPFITATGLPSGRSLVLPTGLLTAPANPVNRGVFLNNSAVFQVKTALSISVPGAVATFAGSGRTGPATVTFCAGRALGTPLAPVCLGPGDASNAINGLMRYTRTANQFGGTAQAAIGGTADIALRGGFAGAPCGYFGLVQPGPNPNCKVVFALATPFPTGGHGAPFGFMPPYLDGGFPNPGAFPHSVTAGGVITNLFTSLPLGAGLPNPATSYGGPWTTGMLTVSVTANVGATPEIFVLTGSDGRVSGTGGVSLVSGTISDRTLSGPNANRGWLQIYVPEPGATLGAVAALLTLVTCHGLTRRAG